MPLQWFKTHAADFSGELAWNEPLAKYTWYRIGGPADLLLTPKSVADLQWIAEGLKNSRSPHFILGAGSNLLVSDSGYRGVVIRANRLNSEISLKDENRLNAGGSTLVSSLLRRCAREGWGGLEFLSGIPGTLGGVVRMNGGTHLGEAKDKLLSVSAFSFEKAVTENYQGTQIKMEYRKNLFLPPDALVIHTEWMIRPEKPSDVKAKLDEVLARRKATQPIDQPSCGSVFKNPRESGLSAWQVIERLGLKGHRIGGAEFSKKHSNFIVNEGGAKASDVKALIDLAKTRALNELGIALHEEVIYVALSKKTDPEQKPKRQQ